MLNWQQGVSEHSASARTVFASFRVHVDSANTRDADDMRYSACVETVNGVELRVQDDLPTVEAARRFCEQSYIDLLRSELDRCLAH